MSEFEEEIVFHAKKDDWGEVPIERTESIDEGRGTEESGVCTSSQDVTDLRQKIVGKSVTPLPGPGGVKSRLGDRVSIFSRLEEKDAPKVSIKDRLGEVVARQRLES